MAKNKKATTTENGSAAKKAKTTIEEQPDEQPTVSNGSSSTADDWNFKIISWNVNGIRAWIKKDGLSILEKEDPDVLCLQETKCGSKSIPNEAKLKGYKSYFMSAEKEGYSGVALYSKKEAVSIVYGIGDETQDAEGRSITAEFENFYVITAYVPNSGRKLVTLPKRMEWNEKFLTYLKDLDAKKPVILCGDLNVAHLEIDLANPKTNSKNAGFTKEERDGFTTLLNEGFIDSYRTLYPDKEKAYTFWTYMMNARAKNVGWRLDYFVLSERLRENLCDNIIHSSVMGSDHCPISLLVRLQPQ